MTSAKATDSDLCPTCGDSNECGTAKGQATCWCFALPHVLPVSETAGRCYCRTCLMREIAARTTQQRR
jgi:uncharacterized protein